MRRVVAAILRLMCVCLALQVVFNLPMNAVTALLNGPLSELRDSTPFMWAYKGVALAALLAIALKSDRIARWVVRDDITIESIPSELLNQTLLRIVVITVGFLQIISHLHLLVVSVIAQAASGIENEALQEAYYIVHGRGGLVHFYWFTYYHEVILHAVWLILGVLMCLFSLPLSRLFSRVFIRRKPTSGD